MSNTKKIPIIQMSKNGEFIKIWRSAKDVENTLKIKRSNICKCLKGERKTAGGFTWKYEKGREETIIEIEELKDE